MPCASCCGSQADERSSFAGQVHAHGLCSGRACIRAQASARLLVFAEPLSMRFVIGIVLILCGLFSLRDERWVAGAAGLVVIAAYNEAPVIASVVADVKRAGYCALVIDDGSTDATGAIAAEQVDRGATFHQFRAGRRTSNRHRIRA